MKSEFEIETLMIRIRKLEFFLEEFLHFPHIKKISGKRYVCCYCEQQLALNKIEHLPDCIIEESIKLINYKGLS